MNKAGLLLLIGGSTMLMASASANVMLYQVAHRYYVGQNQIRLDPMGLDAYSDEDPPPHDGRDRILIFGDSRAQGWPMDPALLPGTQILNRGIGGETTAQSLGRFEADVSANQPDLVIVQVGVNELKTIPLFPERERDIVERCKSNLQEIVTRSRALGADVVLTTVFPVGEATLRRRLVWSDAVPQAVDEVNQFMATLIGPGVSLFHTAPVLAEPDGHLSPDLSQDLLHLNARGYEALNEAILPHLREALAARHGRQAYAEASQLAASKAGE